MPFVNEVVSDEDIDRYGLPFEKGSGRYWTRDAERDFYLWGGKVGNPAFGIEFEGQFHLYAYGVDVLICLEPGAGSSRLSDRPFIVRWSRLKSISPSNCHGLGVNEALLIMKEALNVYGRNGRSDSASVPIQGTGRHTANFPPAE
ncbi:hypothetical protein NZK32_04255, partial [Cyanobium sp. FGCU-52]|nr:hypothetical protein [Cyanobium sp. FGCU52]